MTSQQQLLQQVSDLTDAMNSFKKQMDENKKSLQDVQDANRTLLQENDNYKARLADTNDELKRLQASFNDFPKQSSPSGPSEVDKLCGLIHDLTTKQAHVQPKQRGPNINLPRFDGSLYSSFEKWKLELENCFNHFGWQVQDPQRATIIPTLLDGFASVQYHTLTENIRKSYTNTMTALESTFSMQKKPLSVRRNYLNRKQKHNESVRDFSAVIMQRFSECNPPLETQIEIFCNNLKPQIAAEIKDDEYNDIRTLVACAERAEHRLRLRQEASDAVNALSFRPRRSQSRNRKYTPERSRSRGRLYDRNRSRSRDRYGYNTRERSRGRSFSRPKYNRQRSNSNTREVQLTQNDRRQHINDHKDRATRDPSRPSRYPDSVNALDSADKEFYADLN